MFDLQFALSGQDLADLYPLLGIAIPPSPPYALNGRLKRDHDTWRYERFSGKVGDSDLGGNLQFDVGGARPRLTATLESRRLDFDDLAGFVGARQRPAVAKPPTRSRRPRRRGWLPARVLPDTPYNLGKLRAMDADVRWKAHRINAPSLPLDDMDAHLLLDDGLLRLDPLNFGVAGGDIAARSAWTRGNRRSAPH